MKQEMMYQVRLQQDNSEIIGWIEERGAKLGAMVEVRILDGLWKVVEVYPTGLEKNALDSMKNAQRNSLKSVQKIS